MPYEARCLQGYLCNLAAARVEPQVICCWLWLDKAIFGLWHAVTIGSILFNHFTSKKKPLCGMIGTIVLICFDICFDLSFTSNKSVVGGHHDLRSPVHCGVLIGDWSALQPLKGASESLKTQAVTSTIGVYFGTQVKLLKTAAPSSNFSGWTAEHMIVYCVSIYLERFKDVSIGKRWTNPVFLE